EPDGDQAESLVGIWQRRYANIVALESVDEGFRDAVALRAFHMSEAGFEADLSCKDARFPGSVGRTIIGQHFDQTWCLASAEALFDGLKHHVTDVRAADARVDDRSPADDFTVVRINDEGAAHDLAIPAVELEAI